MRMRKNIADDEAIAQSSRHVSSRQIHLPVEDRPLEEEILTTASTEFVGTIYGSRYGQTFQT